MNTLKKQWFGDTMFLIQIAGAVLICGGQFFRFLETTEGQSFSAILLIQVALAFNLWLAVPTHREAKSRLSSQVVWSLSVWSVLNLSNIFAVLISQVPYQWSVIDAITLAITGCGVLVLVFAIWYKNLPLADPLVKGVVALSCRMAPWVLMAYKIEVEGNAGVPGLSVVAGLVTTGIRVIQTGLVFRFEPDNRSAKWLFISESGTCFSWILVSVVWLSV